MTSDLMNRRLGLAAVWLLLFLGSVYVFVFEPGKTGFFPSCPFKFFTGLNCPGCGSTRALHQLLHGHVEAAFLLNPLFVIALPFMAFAFLKHNAIVFRGGVPRGNTIPASYLYALFFIVLSFWIFRNTPFYPFVS